MPNARRRMTLGLFGAAAWIVAGTSAVGTSAVGAADLPFEAGPHVAAGSGTRLGGKGFAVPRWPVRPEPRHFDIDGYPILGPRIFDGADSPAFAGCMPVVEPAYDAAGNFLDYAPIPFCR